MNPNYIKQVADISSMEEASLKVTGHLKGEWIEVSADQEILNQLKLRGYGFEEDGSFKLSLVEAAYLAWTDKLELSGIKGRGVDPLLRALSEKKPEDFLKFLVFQDLRRRGRLVRYEPRTPFLRLYPPGATIGSKAANVLVFPMSEDELVRQKEVLRAVLHAGRLRKRLLLAIVGTESDITYYYAENFMPNKIRDFELDLLPEAEGILIHDRVVIWDTEVAAKFYMNGFWGHPMGVRKPKPDKEYRRPLQLSLMEAIYLNKKGVLRIKDSKGRNLSQKEILDVVRKFRSKAEARIVTYSYWRDMGYVVKSSAAKYGGHYLIYEKGPGIDHAPYLCVVSYPEELITPVNLLRVGRVATSVNKTLVISVVRGSQILNYKMKWERALR
ncbi:MAG TPA: tRNA-intron lyase [Candidatus Korarchaeota archaeon]|nr:tRNA-intron lyase [Candidatus Korarchaeota archaeon]